MFLWRNVRAQKFEAEPTEHIDELKDILQPIWNENASGLSW